MPTSQPPTPGSRASSYRSTKPHPMRNLSEFAVADTPGTAGPEYAGGDYLDCRLAPIDSQTPGHAQHHHGEAAGEASASGGEDQQKNQGGVPTALERGVRSTGPVDDTERSATRYLSPGGSEQQQEKGEVKQNENVDAEAQMETYAEGKVADAVEGTQRQQQQQRRRGGSMSISAGGGEGGSPAGQGLHGRGRGEVTLAKGEADLERKKQQQAAARKQVMDARKRGEDVDGRGPGGMSERQPRAEID
ncbi:hypothetical protein NEMBOFW57_000162 [Staphylotrichum longicolle]|uniref:Uncharacterized protein n=1 Tax=Staphylotrichum longicolle TaxID=669026 RepID=A0AAD4HWV2_9PEZI|nr:hypothetical protein NEMBOFW57_000162 [Staphylotrichum longicolle]